MDEMTYSGLSSFIEIMDLDRRSTDNYHSGGMFYTELGVDGNIRLEYIQYESKRNVFSFNLIINGKVTKIYTRTDDIKSFVLLFNNNIDRLSGSISKINNSGLFIDGGNYNVYQLDANYKIDMLSMEHNYKKLFGTKIGNLNKEVIYNHRQFRRKNQRSSELTDKIDHWEKPNLNMNYRNIGKEIANKPPISNYDNNVIVQLGGSLARDVEKLYYKYRGNALVIQFDIESQQWKVLKGNLNKLKEGEIRWVFLGHGSGGGITENKLQNSSAKSFSSGVNYLKNNVLNQYVPDKIVIDACKLARGGVDENFLLNVQKMLVNEKFNIPIVGYSRSLHTSSEGNRLFHHNDNDEIVAVRTKEYRLEFTKKIETDTAYINGKPVPLFFLDEFKRGELSLGQLQEKDNSNFMAVFKNSDDEINFELIRKIAFNPKAYEIFKNEMKHYNHINSKVYYERLYTLLSAANIVETPLFRMVEPNKIKNQSTGQAVTGDEVTVILRFNGNENSKKQAENLAANNPNKTIVIQVGYDKWTKLKFIVEYGDINQLNNDSPKKWFLVNSFDGAGRNRDKFVLAVKKFMGNYNINKIDDLSFILTDADNSDGNIKFTDNDIYALKDVLETDLKRNGVYSSDLIFKNSVIDEVFNKERNVYFLLKKLSLGEVSITEFDTMLDVDARKYFANEKGELDRNKINILIHDPIVSERINKYFHYGIIRQPDDWNAIFRDGEFKTLIQCAEEAKLILKSLSENGADIQFLSEISEARLKSLFPMDSDFNYGDVIELVSNPEKLSNYFNNLDKLIHRIKNQKWSLWNMSLKEALEYVQSYGDSFDDEQTVTRSTKKSTFEFTVDSISEKLMSLDESKKSIEIIKSIQKIINNKNIDGLLDPSSKIRDYAITKQQLEILCDIDVNNQDSVNKSTQKIKKLGLKLPAYARYANYGGQFFGGLGIITTLNNIYQLIDELENDNLNENERKEIEKKIGLMCSSAFFNYGDMLLQPILLKIAYKKTGPFKASGKLAARITMIFNFIDMGLDAYQACEAFEKLQWAMDSKEYQDLAVSGALSTINIVVGGITITAIIVGSSTIPVVGVIIGGVLFLASGVYTGIRAVEKIEELLGEELSWDEKAREGIRAAFGSGPSDDILNRLSYKQHLAYFKDKHWQLSLEQFKSSLLYQGYEENLQYIENPNLKVSERYYIKEHTTYAIFSNSTFEDIESTSPLIDIKEGELGSCYTLEQINHIMNYYAFDPLVKKWVKTGKSIKENRRDFVRRFFLKEKEAPVFYEEVSTKPQNNILVLNNEYASDLLIEFLREHNIVIKYSDMAGESIENQLMSEKPNNFRFFRSMNQYQNTENPDFYLNRDIKELGNEFVNEPTKIAESLRSDKPEVIYEGMHNIGYAYEEVSRVRDINFNFGGGVDVIIGKKLAKNSFESIASDNFFAGGIFDDTVFLSFKHGLNIKPISQLYFDGNKGSNTLVINGLSKRSQVNIDLVKNDSEVIYSNGNKYKIRLNAVNNIVVDGYRGVKSNIKGNEFSNLLDAGKTIAAIYGDAGDDHLIFESGVVDGGDGNDSYYLRRYEWESTITDDSQKRQLVNLSAEINETTNGTSKINLGYSLDEIVSIDVLDGDLIVTIHSARPNKNSDVIALKLKLNGAYKNRRELNHQYLIYTRDGFVLSPVINETNNLNELGIKHTGLNENILYGISYQKDGDSINMGSNLPVIINEEENNITINDFTYTCPSWGKFEFIGNIKFLTYMGNDDNNKIVMLDKNSRVMVSKGKDLYHINLEPSLPAKLVFDFLNVKGNYTNEDGIIISLQNENGHALKVDGNSVYLENISLDRKLEISFVNNVSEVVENIFILDENKNLFQVKINGYKCEIIPVYDASLSTDLNDSINVTLGHQNKNGIVEALGGDDFINNNSGKGKLIDGGDGNDTIISHSGINVLYGGDGNDNVYGGKQEDLLLSDLGNDVLNGRKGNDHYIIDGFKGEGTTRVYDNEGVNNIHLVSFNTDYEIKEENNVNYKIYTSISKLRTVKIALTPATDKNKNYVHHYEKLPTGMLNNTSENMRDLLAHLAKDKQKSTEINPLSVWRPMHAFKGAFNNTELPINLESEKNTIPETANFSQLVVNLTGKNQKIWDKSGHGRVFKAKVDTGSISSKNGNNVLYAEKGEVNLYGGEGDDVFISNGNNGLLSDEKGTNRFIVNGEIEGWNSIYLSGGVNKIYLVGFNKVPIVEKPDHVSNAIRYIYESESARRVKIFQYPNTQAPTIVHIDSISGMNEYNNTQRLAHLSNLLAEIRWQDEYNHVGVDEMSKHWQPVPLVDKLLQ